jgi:hypothetical protein
VIRSETFEKCLAHVEKNGTEGQKLHAARIAVDLARSRARRAPTDPSDDLLAEVRVVAQEVKVVQSYSGLLGLCGFCWGLADLVQDAGLLVEVSDEPLLLYSVATSVCVTTIVSLAIAVAILGEVRKQDSEANQWLLENCEIPGFGLEFFR